jgi:signal transduction histidine kinase/anti-sigma regulatory factor (Ser/Thr protein kinase)
MTENPPLKLRPVARLVKIIGEHLIGDNTTGVMELIKNGYDADANGVTVELRNLLKQDETEVIVEDDGIGMDESIIRGPWSEPAHGSKETQKEEMKRTTKGRLPLGEKGVGRFAAQRLGHHLDMITRPEGSKVEYRVKIEWDKFDTSSRYIDEVSFPLERREPKYFTGDRHGTRLIISSARTQWTRKEGEKLQARLMRLLSPDAVKKDFNVTLKIPEFPQLEKLDPNDLLNKYQFKIECDIDAKGNALYSYFERKPDGKIEELKEKVNLWAEVNDDWQKHSPACGPFRVVICAWLRTTANLKEYDITREQLNNLCGISIYRDGFRVIPYGDENNDWLGLALRRVKVPGEKYDNDQVIGRVEIVQEKNKALLDKTSREGLQENQAFADMKDLTLGAVKLLENESLEEREKMKKPAQSKKNLEKKIKELTKEIEEIKNSRVQPGAEPVNQPGADVGRETAEPVRSSEVISVPVSRLEDLTTRTREISSTADELYSDLIENKEEQREVFLHLVGIGLAAERFSHEFDRLVGILSSNLAALEEKYSHNPNVKALRVVFDTLRNEIRLWSVARYVKNPPGPKNIDVREILRMVLEAHRRELDDNSITVEEAMEEGFNVKISVASLSQVLDNVISNAIYWLAGKSEASDRKLSVKVNGKEREIVICNNGPKVQPNVRKNLFKYPFVSSKPNGRGLGMYICSEIMKQNKGSIDLLSEDSSENKYAGAGFLVSLKDPS